MKNISNYTLDKKVSELVFVSTYSAHLNSDIRKKALISIYKKLYFWQNYIAKLKYEYNFLKNNPQSELLGINEIIDNNYEVIIIMEYFDGITLKSYIEKNTSFDVKTFLEVAFNISEKLNTLHNIDIFHNHLTPYNILINEKNNINVIHYGIPQIQYIKNISMFNEKIIKYTLPYISPEQTGRIKRLVDYKTDFYSLGIISYEMLTGYAPFVSDDTLEIIHSHLAKSIKFDSDLYFDIPEMIINLIQKLTSKIPEERYCNAEGLRNDLLVCLNNYIKNNKIELFSLGQKDIPARFDIHHKIYGRKQEIELIRNIFEKTKSGNTELILISGPPGIGKTTLINEAFNSIYDENVYFASGKFDEITKTIPYSGLILVFREIIKRILSESEQEIEIWKEKISKILDINGQIIIDIIPELEMLIGKQQPIMPLNPIETHIRFNFVLKNFISTFTSNKSPLIIFLDDLQWIDSASLNLIKFLISESSVKYLLLIGAYRDNEVDKSHILFNTINEIVEKVMQINKIELKPLELKYIAQLIGDAFECEKNQINDFVDFINKKTNGNPFFIYQYLYNLYKNKLIGFECFIDIERNKNLIFSDNIVDLMVEKIKKLPDETIKCLEYAACFGDQFDIETLSSVYNNTIEKTYADLTMAIKEGLILNFSNYFKFYHDKIAESINILISEKEKKGIHLKIGNLIYQKTPKNELSEKYFDIATHLNFALDLITLPEEKIKAAEINLKAAEKAKQSNAYLSALKYVQFGISLINEKNWNENYILCYSLYSIECECYFLTGNFDEAEKLFENIFKRSKTKFEKGELLNLKIKLYSSRGKFSEANRIGIEALKLFNLNLPEFPEDNEIVNEFNKVKKNIGKRKVEDIINSKELNDPEKLIIIKILIDLSITSYLSNHKLFSLSILKVVNISLKYGNSSFSSYANMLYALMLMGVAHDIETGYKFAQLALSLNDKFKNINQIPKLYEIFGGHVSHWKLHLRTSLKYMKEAYDYGLKVGDIIFATFSSVGINLISISKGDNLHDIYNNMQTSLDFIKTNKDENVKYFYLNEANIVVKLTDLPGDPFKQINQEFDQDNFFIKSVQKEEPLVLKTECYAWKLMLNYILGNDKEAFIHASDGEKYFQSAPGIYTEVIAVFYYSLIVIANFYILPESDKDRYEKKLNANLDKLKEWTKYCPENFKHKYLLIKAELSRLKNKKNIAIKLYDQAIEMANKNEFIHEEALGYELAGKFYLKNGRNITAGVYIGRAIECYIKWGANVKVVTWGKQIFFDKLIKTLMYIIMENAGAEKGIIIISKSDELYVTAVCNINNTEIEIINNTVLDKYSNIPKNIINYVKHTLEDVIIDDAGIKNAFYPDKYILKNKPKSILCIPILKQSHILAILYLENNLITYAFTKERIEILKLLCSQIAISMENALLYKELFETNQELKTLDKMKDNFLSNISHELNTPLTVIKGYIDLILSNTSGHLDVVVENQLKITQKKTEHIKSLIENLINYAKIVSKGEKLKLVSFNINELIKEIAVSLKLKTEVKKIIIALELPDEPIIINADNKKIARVIINLLENAIKFTDINGKIKIKLMKIKNDFIQIDITDTGIGIAPEEHEKIFEKFYQVDNSIIRKYSGMGIGLSISKLYIELHEGKIWVKSKIGEGSTFSFIIPIKI
ncbi:AAA family ATPase [Candidatus Desantisbacteria bacterium]|nr:AAA family ATPase [Candidatus Desantisbacteria bacterium]